MVSFLDVRRLMVKGETGLMKLGAIIGDHVEIGCNAVVSPGSVLGRHSVIYPNVLWQGLARAQAGQKPRPTVDNRSASDLG